MLCRENHWHLTHTISLGVSISMLALASLNRRKMKSANKQLPLATLLIRLVTISLSVRLIDGVKMWAVIMLL